MEKVTFTIWYIVDNCIVLSTDVSVWDNAHGLSMARFVWDTLFNAPGITMKSARP